MCRLFQWSGSFSPSCSFLMLVLCCEYSVIMSWYIEWTVSFGCHIWTTAAAMFFLVRAILLLSLCLQVGLSLVFNFLIVHPTVLYLLHVSSDITVTIEQMKTHLEFGLHRKLFNMLIFKVKTTVWLCVIVCSRTVCASNLTDRNQTGTLLMGLNGEWCVYASGTGTSHWLIVYMQARSPHGLLCNV